MATAAMGLGGVLALVGSFLTWASVSLAGPLARAQGPLARSRRKGSGTSLGVSMGGGTPADGGHANHLRVINEVRRYGSIATAVDAGYIDGGVMYECVRHNIPFVLAGSIRDDGPLPEVLIDVLEAQR